MAGGSIAGAQARGRSPIRRVSCPVLFGERSDPDRPALNVLDPQDRVEPGVVREVRVDLVRALRREDEQCRPEVGISERATQDDHALFGEAVNEDRVLVPTILLPPWPRAIPTRPGKLSNEEVIQPAPPR